MVNLYHALISHYGDPHWWPARTPFEVMVGAVLTQNTVWSNVEKAIANFGDRLSADFIEGVPTDELIDIICPSGFYNQKSVYLKEMTAWYNKYNYSVEAAQKQELSYLGSELLRVKGIGRETADSILLYAFVFPTFVVDAYTKRLLTRLGVDVKLDYESVKAFFEEQLPPNAEMYNIFHALIVIHVKEHCRAKPMCAGCILKKDCSYDGEIKAEGLHDKIYSNP